jgi:hypothetical protein
MRNATTAASRQLKICESVNTPVAPACMKSLTEYLDARLALRDWPLTSPVRFTAQLPGPAAYGAP